jgi:rhodanese-related sulfurtransferase
MAKTLADFVTEARSRIKEIDPQRLEELIRTHDDLLLVDVREPHEFANEHLEDAILVPRGTLEGAADAANKRRVDPLYTARNRPIVVYCDTGARSAMAADTLQQMGFTQVYNLAGGIELWIAEDLPVVTEAASAAWVT